MAPFANNVAESFLSNILNGAIRDAGALIMISDDAIVSENIIKEPKLIAQTT